MRWLDGIKIDGDMLEQALGVGDGQGSLVCCSPWGCRVGNNWETELKIVESRPITLWETELGKVETVIDFHFSSTKIIVHGDYSHEIKRDLLFGRKAMTNLDSVLKSRDIHSMPKVHIVKAVVFPAVMWELHHKDGWTLKNWCFQMVVLEKTGEPPGLQEDQTSQT